MPNKKLNGSLNSEKIATEWLELGIRTVPLWPGQKKPRGSSWQKMRVTEANVGDYFKPGDNIGGLWGSPSGWIVDVDLDDEDAADLASFLLPTTFTFGRQSRPQTHFLYYCKGAKTHKWMDDKKRAIVELRSTGSQTVLPPSIHPDNERYITDDRNNDSFTAVPRLKLVKYLNEIAAGTLFLRNYPEGGSRHDYVHALTGALLWSKWEPEEARRFARAIVNAARHMDDDIKQRFRTIENTIEHHKQGHRIMGWKTLKEWINPKEIQLMRTWLENKDHIEPAPKMEEMHAYTSVGRVPKFDVELGKVPGLVGELVKWSAQQTYLAQPSFDLAVGLMCTALVSCNHYEVDNWHTPLQPYFMLLAPTAAGKGSTLHRVFEFAAQVGLDPHIYQGFQSYHALMDELSEPPNMACWLWDEAARHLQSARSTGSQDFQILSHLISLYGQANQLVPGQPGRKNPIPALNNPFLTLFATAQPAALVEAISSADIATGFINRFMLFDAGDDTPRRNQRRERIFPAAIKRTAKAIKSHEPRGGRTVIRFSNVESFTMFDDFAEAARQKLKGDDANTVWGRANQNALIAAGIVAVGIDPKKPRITPELASWAIQLTTWSIESWLVRIEELTSGSFREKYSKKVEAIIRNPKALITKKTRAKQKSYLEKGMVPKSILTMKCRSLNSREIEDILEQLLVIGLIGQSELDDGTTCYWAKR